MVLYVGDVGHRITHLKVNLVGTVENAVVDGGKLGIDFGLRISGLGKHVAVTTCSHSARCPRKSVKAHPVDIDAAVLKSHHEVMNAKRSIADDVG